MYDPYYWQYYYTEQQQESEQLRLENEQLRQENEELRTYIEGFKPINIERIEYKIQGLSIETLSGMLNIGVNLNGESEEFADLAEKLMAEEGVAFRVEKEKKEGPNSQPLDNVVSPDSRAEQQSQNKQSPQSE